jgi:hypothetical protein
MEMGAPKFPHRASQETLLTWIDWKLEMIIIGMEPLEWIEQTELTERSAGNDQAEKNPGNEFQKISYSSQHPLGT